jgi:type 1 glutamine amidotransferase
MFLSMSDVNAHHPMKDRALVLCDDAWHPAELVREGLSTLKGTPFEFEFMTRGDEWSQARMQAFSVVVVAKANHLCATNQRPWLTDKTQSAFRSFVQAGGGLFLIHGGVCYRELPEMRDVAGGAFLSHPDPCPVTIQPKAGHPLTASVESFTVHDEQYVIVPNVLKADVFLRTRSEHGTQPAGWIRTEGEGRVCVLTPGHGRDVSLHAGFQTLVRNGLAWLGQSNVDDTAAADVDNFEYRSAR